MKKNVLLLFFVSLLVTGPVGAMKRKRHDDGSDDERPSKRRKLEDFMVLPDEIKSEIFKFLPIYQLLQNLGMANKELHSLVNEHFEKSLERRELCLRITNERLSDVQDFNQLVGFLTKFGPAIRIMLDVCGCRIVTQQVINFVREAIPGILINSKYGLEFAIQRQNENFDLTILPVVPEMIEGACAYHALFNSIHLMDRQNGRQRMRNQNQFTNLLTQWRQDLANFGRGIDADLSSLEIERLILTQNFLQPLKNNVSIVGQLNFLDVVLQNEGWMVLPDLLQGIRNFRNSGVAQIILNINDHWIALRLFRQDGRVHIEIATSMYRDANELEAIAQLVYRAFVTGELPQE